jgi:flavodoxin/NAD-dependent dihydropyrimidine dehydrogenase PreA subunit
MSIEIYYYSTTGNSLSIAKEVAQKIKGRLISISATQKLKTIKDNNVDVIGIIFPVYFATFGEKGLPYFVEDFLIKIENIKEKYIFAICTHSGYDGFTIENLNHLLIQHEGKLSASLSVKLGNPFSILEKISHLLLNKPLKIDIKKENKKRKKLKNQCSSEIETLCDAVLKKKELRIRKANVLKKYINHIFQSLQRKMAIRRYQQLSKLKISDFKQLVRCSDNSFTVSNRCNACGICQKVCPVDNIEIVNNKPKWRNNCQNCYSCFQWCPKEAIGGEIIEFEKRYHPDIKLDDIITDDLI